jgi:uncharacterized membrane protein YeaQ/YmgE (transglycosylase-associated protein family)
MFTAEFLILIIIEIATGAASAVFVANLVPPLSFGFLRNATIGAIGGLVLTWLTARIPGLEQFVEDVEEAATAGDGLGGLSPELLLGVGVAGLLGGALLVTILGLVRNRART